MLKMMPISQLRHVRLSVLLNHLLRPLNSVTVCCRCYSSEGTPEPEATKSKRKDWSAVRQKYKELYPNGWQPQKKLTRYQMDYLRSLRTDFPSEWTITKLSTSFGISHSAVKRILKSKFEPSQEVQERQDKRAQEIKEKRHTSSSKELVENQSST